MPSCVISCMFFSSNFSPETFLFVPSSPNLLLSFPLIFPSPMRALWSPPSIRISQSSHHSYLLYFSSIFSLSLCSEWGLFAATSFSFPLFTAVVLPISHFLMPCLVHFSRASSLNITLVFSECITEVKSCA